MINIKLNLREKEIDGFMPTLTTYIPDDSLAIQPGSTFAPRKRPAVLVCPGGGYMMCSPLEAEPVAMHFANAGFSAFVLDYPVAPIKYPESLKAVSNAIRLIRENAEEWLVDEDKIVVCGFSAGGHLTASIGTLWNSDENIKCADEKNKPNALILSYPVIMWGEKTHKDSFYNLLGAGLPEEEYEKFSLDKRVTKDTPPAFIWHTFEDSLVPMENSIAFANALRENDIPFELHIYHKGDHGYSLATKEVAPTPNPHVATWGDLAIEWINGLFC